MKVLVVSDAHIFRTEDNKFWCNTAMHGYSFWCRYLEVFEQVAVIARVKEITNREAKEKKYIRADGDGVEVVSLPFIRGMKGYLLHFLQMKKECQKVAKNGECAIFRLPSIPAYLVLREYLKSKKPFAVEVVIDPEDEYSNIPILKQVSVCLLKKVCKRANGVSYVTKYYLQEKYPCTHKLEPMKKGYFESYYSSIDLSEDFFYHDREYKCKRNEIKILHVANSINNMNKGHAIVLKIIEELKKENIKASVVFVGSGDLIGKFMNDACEMGIDDRVEFVGYVSDKNEIRNYMINSDMFVFPTRAEGLPRVLIEAMATGLPCLSSNVDGIPELLDKEYLFSPDDVNGYVNKVLELIGNEKKLENMGMSNIERAKEYKRDILNLRRKKFYENLKSVTKYID